jgi:anti-sigma factor RsiW
VTASGRRFSVELPDWGQDHLSAEAVAAYVDGELDDRPYDRATRHLATCGECAAQVVAQGQASAALQSARCPSLPSSLMKSLRSIPQAAQVPPAPNGLAMTSDGQMVVMLAPAPEPHRSSAAGTSSGTSSGTSGPPAGLAESPPQNKGLRGRLGTGAAISGLALGALALGAAIIAGDAPPSPTPGPGSGPVVVDAHLQLPGAP